MAELSPEEIQEWNNEALTSVTSDMGVSPMEAVSRFNEELDLDVQIVMDTVEEAADLMSQGMTPMGIYAITVATLSEVEPTRMMQAFASFITKQTVETYVKEATTSNS